MAVLVQATQGFPPMVLVLLLFTIAMAMVNKVTLTMGPLKMTLHKARKRRRRAGTSRRRNRR